MESPSEFERYHANIFIKNPGHRVEERRDRTRLQVLYWVPISADIIPRSVELSE